MQQQANVFSGLSLSLDRTAERRDDADWIRAQAELPQARFLLLDTDGRAFHQRNADALRWLDGDERTQWLGQMPASLLGHIGDTPYFLIALASEATAQSLDAGLNARRASLRASGLLLPALEAGLFAYAKGLAHWQRETRHCSFCGTALVLVSAGHRAKCSNADCGRLHFPRTDAAIIVVVEHDGACLLGRQATWPPGRYSTLAGFVEPGESLEDAVRREVAEESGVLVDKVHYHSSQPWPMPASLMVGFTATAHSAAIQRRDSELEDARWFTPQDIIEGVRAGSLVTPPPLSVSYQLLSHWLRQRDIDLDALRAGAPPLTF